MPITIIGDVDIHRQYCAGSFTKLVTTYVCLSLLSEKYDLNQIIDDKNFLDTLCKNEKSKHFLSIFQNKIGSQFSIRDICSYYTGLPYTFDLSEDELAKADAGYPFKHHSILDEKTFLDMCENCITPVYHNESKFHYSELSIIFLGYFIEQAYEIKIEELYQKFILNKFNLQHTQFSRKRTDSVYIQDLSDRYDYPSIAILDHGYFCYSNGYYTTLADMKILLENLLSEPVFHVMTDIKHARAASNRLLNGLAVEIRLLKGDILYGYEGLSYSGCNIWAYSTKEKKGYLTFSNDEDAVYDTIYNNFGSTVFDVVPAYSQVLYNNFIKHYNFKTTNKNIPEEYQGSYHRVKINEKELNDIFTVAKDFIVIRNPDEIKYDTMYVDNYFRIKCKDNVHGVTVGLYHSKNNNHYMLFDGTLYQKIV
ncbi:MAG: serine hydrolase [Gammaproteobacteria bacterium]|nr:serine hydrolase [Gammaproteobacteria bacterium]